MTINSYEGVEAPGNFRDHETLKQYRATVLEKSRLQAEFIRRHYPDAASLIEACCGNGRLLMALAGDMSRLEGFDIAASRIAFAKQWLADSKAQNITANVGDLLEYRAAAADVVVCITGALGYFDALVDDGGCRAVQALGKLGRPGGGLVLELYPHPKILAHCGLESDGVWQHWHELPAQDPFRFYMSHYRFDDSERLLHHQKTFIGRDGSIDEGRNETLRIYDAQEISELLAPHYDDIRLFSGWLDEPYEDSSDSMIVTARRRSEAS